MTDETNAASTARSVRVARVIAAPPAALWRAWTDPAIARTWWGKTGSDAGPIASYDVDLRVGGRFRLVRQVAGQQAPEAASGEILEISAPNRLVFSWAIDEPAAPMPASRVTVEFADLRDGSSRAAVTHEGLADKAAQARYQGRWSDVLQDLGTQAAG
jgi:uncharacterized protein YndB with AHSA1/START domain